jgi:hypothetical protein
LVSITEFSKQKTFSGIAPDKVAHTDSTLKELLIRLNGAKRISSTFNLARVPDKECVNVQNVWSSQALAWVYIQER